MADKIIPSERYWSAGVVLNAFDGALTKPGNGSYYTCYILVPFAHRLLAASFSCTDVDVVNGVSASLHQADSGDAKAGTLVDALGDVAAVADLIHAQDFILSGADFNRVEAARVYFLLLLGTDAGDLIEEPTLTIVVQPLDTATQERSRL